MQKVVGSNPISRFASIALEGSVKSSLARNLGR
jgi:hypothetical protein